MEVAWESCSCSSVELRNFPVWTVCSRCLIFWVTVDSLFLRATATSLSICKWDSLKKIIKTNKSLLWSVCLGKFLGKSYSKLPVSSGSRSIKTSQKSPELLEDVPWLTVQRVQKWVFGLIARINLENGLRSYRGYRRWLYLPLFYPDPEHSYEWYLAEVQIPLPISCQGDELFQLLIFAKLLGV